MRIWAELKDGRRAYGQEGELLDRIFGVEEGLTVEDVAGFSDDGRTFKPPPPYNWSRPLFSGLPNGTQIRRSGSNTGTS